MLCVCCPVVVYSLQFCAPSCDLGLGLPKRLLIVVVEYAVHESHFAREVCTPSCVEAYT
jgi:hypothetical protein